ncbi:MAG: hypothetical protein Q9193_005957, partial [Seirophora villosa]
MEVPVEGAAPRDGPGQLVRVMEIRNETVQYQTVDLEPLNEKVRDLWLAKKHHGDYIRYIRRDRTLEGADVGAEFASVNEFRALDAEATERRLRSVEDAASAAQLAQEQFEIDVDDRLEAQASDARDAVRSLQDWIRRLEDEIQRINEESRQLPQDLAGRLERSEDAVERLATELGRLSIDADPAAPGDDPPTSAAPALWHDEPAVPYATDGRVDELERTFHACHRRLQARTAELERLGRANRDASNATIRACNTQLARYTKRMQTIDAVHTTVRARLRDHAAALRRQTARISAAERTAQAHRAETDDRLRDQSTRLDRVSDTLAGADIRPLERALDQVRWDQANDVARLEDFGARLDVSAARLDTTNTQVREHAAIIRHTLHNHRSRLDATDTQLDGHSADLRRIDSILQELGSSHTTLGDRVDR